MTSSEIYYIINDDYNYEPVHGKKYKLSFVNSVGSDPPIMIIYDY